MKKKFYKPIIEYDRPLSRKEAMEESLKMWAWLGDYKLNLKCEHPQYDLIKKQRSGCFLCTLYFDLNCKDCPVKCFSEPEYNDWFFGRSYAGGVYDKIANAYTEEFGELFNPYLDD